ncbi:MAG TPA: winged helix-turn-helix domain-containing protein [Streptosporangiaceae bacterium]
MRVDHDDPEPVYRQIAGIIRGRIESGRYPPGSLVPSIERIRQETGCAVLTIRKAVQLLESEGLVRVVPGKGTFVTPEEDR